MRRRSFVGGLLGAAVAPPFAPHAQQARTPVIGFLNTLSEAAAARHQVQFRRGLGETGFVPGRNVAIEFRWAEGRYDRLPGMAVELVGRGVDLIVAQAPPAALAARTATTRIPIVFAVGIDPVAAGLVASYNRPGGNATGVTLVAAPLGQKRLEILREVVPKAATAAVIVNPFGPDAAPEIREVQIAAQAMGIELRLLNASNVAELESAFKAIEARRPDGLLMGTDPFYLVQAKYIVERIARLGLVAVHPFREFVEAGGLVSYGTNIANMWRQVGIYAGRILKGAKPADLPVLQPTTFELVINLKTAEAQRIDISPRLHARSDDVIE